MHTPHVPTDDARYWFPAKRYGWGWGVPRTWQGWLVLLGFCAVVLVAAVTAPDPRWTLAVVVLATVALLLICLKKGEPTRWRWGGDR